jgi:hypothetical protein
MEEYSRRGSNQSPKRAKKPTISNRWFSGNFRLALTRPNVGKAQDGSQVPEMPGSHRFIAFVVGGTSSATHAYEHEHAF